MEHTTKTRSSQHAELPRSARARLPRGLEELLATTFPGAAVEHVRALGVATAASAGVTKAAGYGAPLAIALRTATGERRTLVFRTATANDFGHDRRSDRAQQMLLAFDTFGAIPAHVEALDVGAIQGDGRLTSLRDAGEFYLLTTYAPGELYAEHLRRVARKGATAGDLARVEALARYLVELHRTPGSRPAVYRRSIRDLVGSGEGIFGIVDGYPEDASPAVRERLRAIEARAVAWRWQLRASASRLRRVHGDFHPFNLVFDGERLAVLDASRGCEGDPADDVTCLAVNFVFFALGEPDAWGRGLGALWTRFWKTYLDEGGDLDLCAVAPPFLAWRLLVLANPGWYAGVDEDKRVALLDLGLRALAGGFDPAWAEEIFR